MPETPPNTAPTLTFQGGTLVLDEVDRGLADRLSQTAWDERTRQHRARAHAFCDFVTEPAHRGLQLNDRARRREKVDLTLKAW